MGCCIGSMYLFCFLPLLDSDHLCRLSAVRYAGKVFSSDHVKSRYFLLLAASDGEYSISVMLGKNTLYTPFDRF